MFGGQRVPKVFSPHGTMPAFKIATSCFSFVQIAPVAGEIKKLGREAAFRPRDRANASILSAS
jgi:hypothetical protein